MMSGKPQGPHRDLTGMRFGRLVAQRFLEERTASKKIQWLCRCDCGNESRVVGADLNNGTTKSCGCLQREVVSKLNLKHGRSDTRVNVDPLYRTWLGMRNRCQNPKSQDWPLYGGRGVTVCSRWGWQQLVVIS